MSRPTPNGLRRGYDWNFFETFGAFFWLMTGGKVPVFRFKIQASAPLRRLHEPVINKIDAGSTSFWAAQNRGEDGHRTLGILERQRVKVWLRNAYEEVDRAGV